MAVSPAPAARLDPADCQVGVARPVARAAHLGPVDCPVDNPAALVGPLGGEEYPAVAALAARLGLVDCPAARPARQDVPEGFQAQRRDRQPGLAAARQAAARVRVRFPAQSVDPPRVVGRRLGAA